jgi:hypothetical protein
MKTAKTSRGIQNAYRDAMQRAANQQEMKAAIGRANAIGGRVLATSETRLVVYFADEEDAYLYEIDPTVKGWRIPGNPVLRVCRLDVDQAAFEVACARLV